MSVLDFIASHFGKEEKQIPLLLRAIYLMLMAIAGILAIQL